MSARIVLTPFGSLGDLHPFLAIASGLLKRGHRVIVATSEVYRDRVLGAGCEFHPVRPDVINLLPTEEDKRLAYHPKWGTEHVIKMLVPHLQHALQDLLQACAGANLVLTHSLMFAGPVEAEACKARWLPIVLQPSLLLSTHDPPVVPAFGGAESFPLVGRLLFRGLLALGIRRTKHLVALADELRQAASLPARGQHPLFDWARSSPLGNLSLFSRHFAALQPDWPAGTRLCGFVFHRDPAQKDLDPATAEFLDQGEHTLVFTLGSSAVISPGSFYRESIGAAERLGRRAILLTGPDRSVVGPGPIPASVHLAEYAPFSLLFPRAAAIVHQGGIGTTAEALRSGRPALVVPYSHDQPDNAARLRRLGVAGTIERGRYRGGPVAAILAKLLQSSSISENAQRLKGNLAEEDGIAFACAAVEEIL